MPIAMQETASANVRAIVETAPRDTRMGALYASFLDEKTIAAKGIAPLTPWLAQIDGADDHAAIAAVMGDLARYDVGALFRVGVAEDDGAPGTMVVTIAQGGTGLPNRDLYSGVDERSVRIRAAYRDYLVRMLTLSGSDRADTRADAVIAFETALAAGQWSAVESRDAARSYNIMTAAQIEDAASGLSWSNYLGAMGLGGRSRYIVAQPSALTREAATFARTPISTLRDYLRLRLLNSYARYLPPAFEDARFAMFGTAMTGATQAPPRWRRGVALITNLIGDDVGKAYIERYFPAAAQIQAQALVRNLMATLDAKLASARWMTPDTRAKARRKLARTRTMIGFPKHWTDYGSMTLRPDDLIGNVAVASAFQFARLVAQLDRPIDRDAWVSPVTVPNAYASASANVIVFPAAYLQAPMFDASADPAINYARIGAVIGHELSHLFDDQGRKYDWTGTLGDWWAPLDEAGFQAREKALIAQYAAYEPVPGRHVDGALTVGENLSDLAGLELAYAAFHRLPASRRANRGGMTGDQRFFLAWAQVWRSKYRNDYLLAQLASDAHAPGRERALTVRNVDAWYTAFAVSPKDALYLAPARRVHFW